jgi:hypothetical protein
MSWTRFFKSARRKKCAEQRSISSSLSNCWAQVLQVGKRLSKTLSRSMTLNCAPQLSYTSSLSPRQRCKSAGQGWKMGRLCPPLWFQIWVNKNWKGFFAKWPFEKINLSPVWFHTHAVQNSRIRVNNNVRHAGSLFFNALLPPLTHDCIKGVNAGST